MKLRKMTYTKNGKTHESEKFYAVFVDHTQTLRRLPLFRDRRSSDEAARKIDKLVSLRASGETLPPELTRFIESVQPRIREKLAEWSIVEQARVAASKPLSDHLADWNAAILSRGNTARHAELLLSRATTVFDGCRFKLWSDIMASKVLQYVSDLREGEDGIGAQTFNFYLQAVKQFCRWMVKDGRATVSPLAHLQGVNVKTDRRHDRRALSVDELLSLLDAARNGPDYRTTWPTVTGQRVSIAGSERYMIYRLAVETGLRRGELESLTRGSFSLGGQEPTVTIAAAYAKNRRQDTLPLKPTTAAELQSFLSHKTPAAPAFNVPSRYDSARMMRFDLERAKIPYQDGAGRKADFHALRHTFISNLAAGGVHPKTAQMLARHGTITLTMDRYSHSYEGQLSTALTVLPDLSGGKGREAKATGTQGASDGAETDAGAGDSMPRRPARSLSPSLSGRVGRGRSTSDSAGRPGQAADAEETPCFARDLTDSAGADSLVDTPRRSGRAVDCAGLENR